MNLIELIKNDEETYCLAKGIGKAGDIAEEGI